MVKDNNTSISICILRLSSIGDVTHIIPIISTIRNVYPKSRISWVIGKTEYELVKNLKNIDFIIVDKNIYNDVITGSICGITASILTQPFDYIKTKKQMYGNNINIKKIMYETNYKQYWRGGGTRAIINCLSMSVGLPIFNFINYNLFNNK